MWRDDMQKSKTGGSKSGKDFRHGVIGIARSMVWLLVSLWIVAATLVGLLRNVPTPALALNVVSGALIMFIVGYVLASIGVTFFVGSIAAEKKRRMGILAQEFTKLLREKDKKEAQKKAERERLESESAAGKAE